MAGNRRGKLKENLEGIHKNLDWVIYHCQKSVVMIGDDNLELAEAFSALADSTKILDEMSQALYSTI